MVRTLAAVILSVFTYLFIPFVFAYQATLSCGLPQVPWLQA